MLVLVHPINRCFTDVTCVCIGHIRSIANLWQKTNISGLCNVKTTKKTTGTTTNKWVPLIVAHLEQFRGWSYQRTVWDTIWTEGLSSR